MTPRARLPIEAVLLNNTFYNDAYAIQTIAPQFDGKNDLAIVNMLAMNNIFDGVVAGRRQHARAEPAVKRQLQYNLFYNNIANLLITTNDADFGATSGPSSPIPDFVGPVGTGDASAQNFELEPDSPAINAARSEIGPNAEGNAIYPTVNLTLAGGVLTADPDRPQHV